MKPNRFTESTVLQMIEGAIQMSGSAKALARKWGISTAYLCDVRRRRRFLTHKILEPLGLVAITEYRRMTLDERATRNEA